MATLASALVASRVVLLFCLSRQVEAFSLPPLLTRRLRATRMPAPRCCRMSSRISLSDEAKRSFWSKGFLQLGQVLNEEQVEACRARMERLFAGEFDTGIYPDEWHWRKGISYPGAVREICNGWKSDRVIASIVLGETFGRAACKLMGWPSARIAQDSVIWKPAGAGSVSWHQDSPYISRQFTPVDDNSLTFWCALDDADEETGVIEYAAGSHEWQPRRELEPQFHGLQDYQQPLRQAAASAGKDLSQVEITRLVVPAGSAVVHHQNTWHGSGENKSKQRDRRALAIHVLRGDVKFVERPGYIYGRYKMGDNDSLHDAFFPYLYRSDGEN
uniref:Phytanoyl-CoA dioxygenase n=1 Tax=Hanusia phi TaxID=3032 RepID=A0A7S0E1W7_9CRYP